jgi:NAD(P)-dependent dehydrogenase (short-subunit alcohol dehydrogenase family)
MLGLFQIRVNGVNPTIIDDTRLGKLGALTPDGAGMLQRTPIGRFGSKR